MSLLETYDITTVEDAVQAFFRGRNGWSPIDRHEDADVNLEALIEELIRARLGEVERERDEARALVEWYRKHLESIRKADMEQVCTGSGVITGDGFFGKIAAAALDQVEWGGTRVISSGKTVSCCPECRAHQSWGEHNRGCQLDAALKLARRGVGDE